METKELVFQQVVGSIIANSDDLIKGSLVAFLDTLTIIPSCGISVVEVKDVRDFTGALLAGYVFSVVPSLDDCNLSFEEVSKKAMMQRFVAIENGRATKYLKYGELGRQQQSVSIN